MIRRLLQHASAYHPLPLGASAIRCRLTPQPRAITVGGVSTARFRLRRTLKSILRLCFRCWSHTPLESKSAQQSFQSSFVAPFTMKISLQAYTFRLRSFSALPIWASRSILIYTFLAMAPIHTKTSNQSMERTATRCVSTSAVAKTLSLRSTLVLGGRRSSLSR